MSRLFAQPFAQAQIKETSKLCVIGLYEESTADQWSQRMRNPQLYVSGKRPIAQNISRYSDDWVLIMYRADSRPAPSQWETSLQSIAVSHWLGANLESAPMYVTNTWKGWQLACQPCTGLVSAQYIYDMLWTFRLWHWPRKNFQTTQPCHHEIPQSFEGINENALSKAQSFDNWRDIARNI